MAIMSASPSHPANGVAFEKAIPVPASEMMAVDFDIGLDISGAPNPQANFDNATASEFAPNALEKSPLHEFTNSAANNLHSFASNQTIAVPSSVEPPSEGFDSLDNLNFSHLPHTNTTSSDAPQQSPEATPTSLPVADALESNSISVIESATDIVISSALEDTAATSTVPPVIEAHITSPLALATKPQIEPPQTALREGEDTPNMADEANTSDGQNVTFDNGVTNAPYRSHRSPPPAIEDAVPSIHDQQPTIHQDTEMNDAPVSATSTKVSREREYDNEDEPSAKRAKTENDTAMADVPAGEVQPAPEALPGTDVPAAAEVPPAAEKPAAQNGEVEPVEPENATTITSHEAKEIIKILKGVARTVDGKNFKAPVRTLWPSFAERYYAMITHPVDLTSMENNLRDQKYPTLEDFKAEVNLIFANTLQFNGEPHLVTTAGRAVRDKILSKIEAIPPGTAVVSKPSKKQRKSTPLSETTPRDRALAAPRPSKSGGAAPAITFALDPATSTPLIRRDSTKLDGGRPKREIHPPKNKDLPYTHMARPKNKKMAQDLKFCEEVLGELKKSKHALYASPFLVPVDPVSLSIPQYFNIIKHPMDISKMTQKLRDGHYQSSKEFEKDAKLMFANCYKFNPGDNLVNHYGHQLEAVFNEAWANKASWLADHAPVAETPSSDGSDDEESEEEVEVEEPAPNNNNIAILSEKLTEEQDKLISYMTAKKKDAQMIEIQTEMVEMIKAKLLAAKANPPTTKKVVKKAKATKPAKKREVAKKPGAGAAKKTGGGRKKYMGTHEKNIISLGITRLPEDIIKDILAMIKGETDVDEGNDGEIELDIDVVSTESLWKIHSHVLKYAPEVVEEARAMLEDKEEEPPAKLAKPPAKKKNKPMSKNEQERKIQQLEGTLQTFKRGASGSQEPMPTVERPHNESTPAEESSSDESDSEED